MSSKILQLLILLLGLSLLSSCSEENQPYFNTPAIAPAGACLDNMAEDIENYFSGQLKDGEVRRFWECQRQALNAFYVSTQGQKADRHSSEELRNFLHSYFARRVRLSNRLMSEILELKSLLVGGDSENITKAEMKKAIELFARLESMTLALRPHIPTVHDLLKSSTRHNLQRAAQEEALLALTKFAEELASLIEENGKIYTFVHLQALIEEVDSLVLQTESESNLKSLIPYIPMLAQSKEILLGTGQESIAGNEWSLLGKRVASVLRILLDGETHIRKLLQTNEGDEDLLQALILTSQNLFVDPQAGPTLAREIPLEQLDRLLDQMVQLNIVGGGDWLSMVKDGLRVLPPILFGSRANPQAISTQDWPLLSSTLITLIDKTLLFMAQPVSQPWYGTTRWAHLKNLMQAGFTSLRLAFPYHPRQTIAYESLAPLSTFLVKYKLLPDGFSEEFAHATLQTLIDKVFAVADNGRRLAPEGGLSESRLQLVEAEYNRWLEAQEYVNWLYGEIPPNTQRAQSVAFTAGAVEIRDLASTPWPLKLDHFGRLTFSWQVTDPNREYDHFSLTQLNWQRAIIRPLMRAYSTEAPRRARPTYLTSEELEHLAHDAVPVIEALGLPLQGNIAIYKKVFREANLFTSRAHRDERLHFSEGLEYLSYVLSGIKSGRLVLKTLQSTCGSPAESNRDLSLDVNCFRLMSLVRQDVLLSHLPNLQAYLKKYNYSQSLWLAMEEEMEKLIRHAGYSHQPISQSEISRMWILLQYIETIMGRFDRDGNGDLGHFEMWSIYDELLSKPSEEFSIGLINNANAGVGFGQADIAGLRPHNRLRPVRSGDKVQRDPGDPFSFYKTERYRLLKFIGWLASE